MKQHVAVGVDGGGTKTRAVVLETAQANTSILTSSVAGASNIAVVTVDEAFQSVTTSVDEALAGLSDIALDALVVGIAGYSHASRRHDLHNRLRSRYADTAVDLLPDYQIAFDGAFAGGPGILVIAGTGQIAYGENERGEVHMAGGYGYIIDDCGSGYGLGRSALAAMLASIDGSGPPTILTTLVAERTGTQRETIVESAYGGVIDRAFIASLAPLVSRAADHGDPVALGLLKASGEALASLAEAIATRLFATGTAISIATVGSVWLSHESLMESFKRKLSVSGISSTVMQPAHDPAIGAALRARRAFQLRQLDNDAR